MIIKNMLIAGLIISCSACSTYKSNSDISFRSIHLSGLEPSMPVVDNAPADQVTYLGWVEAEVRSPSYFHQKPSKEQVNIVLAKKAEALQADAVIHMNYKPGITMSTRAKLTGHGQAVRINAWHIGEPDPAVVMAEHKTKDLHEKEQLLLTTPEIAARALDQPETLPAAPVSTLPILTKPIARTSQHSENKNNMLNHMLKNAELLKQRAKNYNDRSMYKAASQLTQQIENYILEYTDGFPGQ